MCSRHVPGSAQALAWLNQCMSRFSNIGPPVVKRWIDRLCQYSMQAVLCQRGCMRARQH